MHRVPGKLILTLLAGLSLSLPGCQMVRQWVSPDPMGPFSTYRMPEELDAKQVVRLLNERGPSKLYCWQADSVSITASGEGMLVPMTLRANLAVQAPRNFRMTAKMLLVDEIDIGSNDERFWFWIRQAPKPYVFTSRHDRIAVAQQNIPIPFQPDWIIEALGVIPIDENDVQLVPVENPPRGQRWGKLISRRMSPQGTPVRKVTLVDLAHGVILEHALYDEKGDLIASAKLSDQHYEPHTNAVVPHRIDLNWPQTRMSLTLKLGPVQVNPQISGQLFALPSIPNCPVVDLGQMTANARPARSANPGRPLQQPVALTGGIEEDEPLPDSPDMQRHNAIPAPHGRVSRRQDREEAEVLE